ncbi:MAG: thiamine pyrophosphate enzyme, central domain family [Dehalococcoidales bacterium]|nr:thiamine pyrophosphate enzyme, central domain family [Dehalococcoidales bacterium]
MKCQTAIAKILKMEGVDVVTGFPNNPLHEAMATEGIRLIMFRTEQVAVQAADGFTRASFGKRIGVTSMQAGPGLEVAFSGIREAFSDGVPILVLPSGEERRRISTDPFFDAVQHFRGLTKWADSVNFADRTPEIMRRAFTYLRTGRPRPVLVEVPTDVMNEEFDDAKFQYKPVKGAKPAGDPADVKEVAKALIAAKNPVIRAGQGVLYACAWDELRELAELLQVPVFTTMNGKSAFPENHPLSLGAGGRTRPKMLVHFLDKADLVFAIGSSCTRHAFGTTIPDGKVIMQSTIDERDINKDYIIEQAIIGDAKLVLKQLVDEIKKQIGPGGRKDNGAVAREIKAIKDEWLKEWMPKLTSDEVPINPYRVYWDLQKALDRKETIVTHDSGTPRDSLVPFWESLIPGGYIGFGKDHMLGAGLGLAMGAKLARPDRTVVNIGGEGAFGMVGMNFETAVRAKIPILTVVLNNGVLGGTLRANPVASDRCGIHVESGNYSKVAEGLGGYTERVERPQDIIPAVQRARKVLASGQPALLEIMSREETEVSCRQ